MMTILRIIALLLIFFLQQPCFAAKDEDSAVSYVNMKWWQEFNDPILTDYIVKALYCNHDLKISTLKTQEAKENKNIVRAKEMPSIGIGAVPALYKLPKLTNSDGLISLPIYTNYELDLFGKNRDKTKAMDKMYEISKQNERAAYISVVSAVGSSYYNIVKLDKLISIQEEIIRDRKQIYELMKLSNEQGLTSTADTVSANKAYIRANSDLIELKKSRENLLNALAVLTGQNPEDSGNLMRIAFDDLIINKSIPDFISSDTIQSRPDYIAAEKMIEKSGLDTRAARKEFLPAFNILGLLAFNSTEFFRSLDWTNTLGILGGGALLPLFTGGSRIANLKLQKNKYEQAIETYQKTNLIAIQEINDALSNLKLDNEKYQKTLESLNAEQLDFYYTQLKFKQGIISNLDLLQKKEALLTTLKLEAQDKTDYFINQINLYKATGACI